MQTLIDLLQSGLEFVVGLFDSLSWLVTNLPVFVTGITSTYAYLPEFIQIFVVMSVSLILLFAVIKLI